MLTAPQQSPRGKNVLFLNLISGVYSISKMFLTKY